MVAILTEKEKTSEYSMQSTVESATVRLFHNQKSYELIIP